MLFVHVEQGFYEVFWSYRSAIHEPFFELPAGFRELSRFFPLFNHAESPPAAGAHGKTTFFKTCLRQVLKKVVFPAILLKQQVLKKVVIPSGIAKQEQVFEHSTVTPSFTLER
ncbi:MAG TPA: hypothetical protein VFB12_03180 [Ktedonobacteraceae bacterium]|nr:hypothetical protein [Ktedonobacteraceae bacterium]